MKLSVRPPVRRRTMRVALVSMPMAAINRPSIQIGLLAAIGRLAGHRVHTVHASLDFGRAVLDAAERHRLFDPAERIELVLRGDDPYSALGEERMTLFGDWLFSNAAFGDEAPDLDATLLEEAVTVPARRDFLRHVRDDVVPDFLDTVLAAEDWGALDVVGFTSTFQQHVSSLALARRIKDRHPDVKILFGGANLEGPMGIAHLAAAPWVDLAVRGEADSSFPALLDALGSDRDPLTVPGVAGRVDGRVVASDPAPPISDLDAQPTPDYDEFFARAARLGLIPRGAARFVALPFESARGCWWGAKRHCTFCGLNGQTMAYRSKSPQRVLEELDRLARRHGTFLLEAVDNIVDRRYLETLFPALAEAQADFRLFYEVKADLSADELGLLARAGVSRIQPGIESLSSHVLGLMRKGTRASWNVNVLRWACAHGIGVSWNLLWGFPGERVEDYTEQAALIPLLVHLPPPAGAAPIWLERFSPLFTATDAPTVRRRPHADYRRIYPNRVDLDAAAYFFDHDVEGALPDEVYEPVTKAVDAWQQAWSDQRPPRLIVRRGLGFLQIVDERSDAPGMHTLEGPAAQLYDACMRAPRTVLAAAAALGAPEATVGAALDAFVDSGLMMRDRALYLALAVPPVGHWSAPAATRACPAAEPPGTIGW